MADETIPEFPTSDDREFGYQVSKTSIGAADVLLPGLGYGLQQLVDRLIGSPLEARRNEWFRRIGTAIAELQARFAGFDPASLDDSEDFISAVYEATDAAMRTHREEKREALQNAVLNAAVGYTLDEVVRGAFMNYIERFSSLHLKVLRLMADPRRSPEMVAAAQNMMMGSQHHILRAAVAVEEADEATLDRALADLVREGLMDGSLKAMVSEQSLLASRTTPIGAAFLRFISEPMR